MYSWTDGSEYLMHYGTKGQRWGTRNYQYEDGTLTPAGIARYRKGMKRISSYQQKEQKNRKKDNSRLVSKASKYTFKASKYNLKAQRAMAR